MRKLALALVLAAACAAGAAPTREPSREVVAPSGESTAASESRPSTPLEMPTPDAAVAVGPPDATVAAQDAVSRPSATLRECATLSTFNAAHVAADGGRTVIPWMVDPLGTPKKGEKKDVALEALRSAFRTCHDAAKKADPTQVVALAFEARPRGPGHEVCVKVHREDGREEVTRAMATCLVQAIRDHAGK